ADHSARSGLWRSPAAWRAYSSRRDAALRGRTAEGRVTFPGRYRIGIRTAVRFHFQGKDGGLRLFFLPIRNAADSSPSRLSARSDALLFAAICCKLCGELSRHRKPNSGECPYWKKVRYSKPE